MKVYDVIAIVAQDAMTSCPKGTYSIRTFGNRHQADAFTMLANENATVPGIAYTVNEIEEESTDRYPTQEMLTVWPGSDEDQMLNDPRCT